MTADPAYYQPQLFGGEHVEIEQTSDSWCTPEVILDPVREFYGEIDLDPCSNEGSTVGATVTYTLADDGLAHPWQGRVYCNPPYSDCAAWLARCAEMPSRGGEAIALPKGDWSTKWWWDHVRTASARCLLKTRVSFCLTEGATTAPFPSVLVYWGPRVDDFARVFGPLGEVI